MDFSNPERITVVQIGKIGDMILITPLLSELKRLFPKSRLTIIASEVNKDIILNNPNADEVIIFHKNILKNISFLKRSYKKSDLWIDTKNEYSNTSELLLKIFKPKFSLGYNFQKRIFNVSLEKFQKGNHAVDINLSPISYFGNLIFGKKYLPEIAISKEIENKISNLLSDFNRKKIVINISAGSPGRYLPKEKWTDVIEKINKTSLSSFILIGLEKDTESLNYIKQNSKADEIMIIETQSIFEAACVIKNSDFVITPDTSVVHICSAFDKPVAALYPDVKWNLEKFAPLSKFNEIIVSGNEKGIDDISSDVIADSFLKLESKVNSGNAESRTRVRKEDH